MVSAFPGPSGRSCAQATVPGNATIAEEKSKPRTDEAKQLEARDIVLNPIEKLLPIDVQSRSRRRRTYRRLSRDIAGCLRLTIVRDARMRRLPSRYSKAPCRRTRRTHKSLPV